MSSKSIRSGFKRSALTVALGLCFAGGVHAQATSGSIYGNVTAGATVIIKNDAGFTRTITADTQGRYTASSLPVGSYTVTSGSNTRDVVVTPGAGANVSFVAPKASNDNTLGTITITANGTPSIDVTQTDTRTVITAAQLKRLPIARSAEAIALLSPGAVSGNGTYFGNQVSFGGSSVAENAYYLNGYFTGNPMTNVGGFQLPYGSIEQQETYTGGYGAKYGRSDGGVISQVGKSGTNKWHFGGQFIYGPKSLQETQPDIVNRPPALPSSSNTNYRYWHPALIGQVYDAGDNNYTWGNTYSAYIGGPIVKDKLFIFASYETTLDHTTTPAVNPAYDPTQLGSKDSSRDPKAYIKLNWNISDKHLLEYTFVGERYRQTGDNYNYDFADRKFLSKSTPDTSVALDNRYNILKYTGYLTDKLTLTALYGHSTKAYNTDPYLTGFPLVNATAGDQDPAITGGATITNAQRTQNAVKNTKDTTDGWRVELEYVLGRHTLSAGIDDSNLKGANEGQTQVADVWTYGSVGDNTSPIQAPLGVGPATTTANGYYVSRDKYFDTTSMKLKQQAWYLEDRWQVTDRLLLSLGLRNDKFQNYNEAGVRFVDSKAQWEPRIGASWDVFGDSSFKVFGNAGRYFLAMPNAVAIRGVGASTYTSEYFTYTGIDPNGAPTGLTPVLNTAGTGPAGPVSADGETGKPKDPQGYVPKDIKSEYQDEFVLGFQANLTKAWTLGAKVTRRELKSAIDDMCDPYTLATQAGLTMDGNGQYPDGYYHATNGGQAYRVSGCYIFNPGGSNTYSFANVNGTGARYSAKVAASSLGPGMGVLKRNYSALDLFLEHPFDGKWEARIDYTYSRSTGNSEGPANSDTGQGANSHDNGVGTSQNYDAWQIMAFANGFLPNDRTHVLKAHGSYAITPDWMIGASGIISSGAPIDCFGYYDPDGSIGHTTPAADPIGYRSSYHTCFGAPWNPGKSRTPWIHTYNVGVTWKPAFLQHKMAVAFNVFNIANKRTPTSVYTTAERLGGQVRERLFQPQSFTTPRYAQLSISYDY